MAIPQGIALVVYDADNTMFNTIQSNIAQLSEVGRQIGLGSITEEQYWSVIIQPGSTILQALFPEKLVEAQAAYREVGQYVELISVEPGLIDVLGNLSTRGLRIGVATNRRERSMRLLFDRFPEVARFFDPQLVFLLQDDHILPRDRRFPNIFKKPKPDPECLEIAMLVTELSPRQILYVGDTPNDQRTARSAGVYFVGYERCETEFGCITIHDHQDLLSFF